MIERLADRLREVDPDLSAEDLADVLWIARLLGAPDARAKPGAPDEAGTAKGADDQAATEPDVDGTATDGPGPEPAAPDGGARVSDVQGRRSRPETGGRGASEDPSASTEQAGLFLPGGFGGGGEPSFPVRAPTLPALPHTLALARALRPLRLAVPSPRPGRLNEERTAVRFADTLIWEPQLDAATERRFELVLVVDVARSMVVWRHTADELRLLLERLGAFRDVRIRYLDTDASTTSTTTEPAERAELPDVVGGAGTRRIVLVVSDCIGAAWQDGRAAALLDRWGRSASVAIAQPLPQRLWRRCAAATERVWLRAAGTGTPNAGLSVRMRDRHAGAVPPGIAVPVLELDRRWLGPWAAMVAGSGTEISGVALFTGRPAAPAAPPEPEPAPEGDAEAAEPSARERVRRFRASASPKAVELAGYLAAAPLRLPVMRLVQGTMMPGSTPAHLAEVFLGGLLRVDSAQSDRQDPSEVAYEFHDGVRDVLLGGLRRDDALHILREVWGTVRDRLGSTLDFPALLAAIKQDPDALPPDQPFAQVATGVLARLGGTYGEVARFLSQSARRNGTGDAQRNGHTQARPPKEGPHAPPLLGGLPPRNPFFHGRVEHLSRVWESLRDDGAATVLLPSAPGALGKTEIALELVHAHLGEYGLVWWIPAGDSRSVRASLGRLARRLGTPLSDDLPVTVANLLRALRDGLPDGRRWLLVYDDAGDLTELTPLMPLMPRSADAAGDVLVTSRDRLWSRVATVIEVDAFRRAESISFLRRRMPGLSEAEAGMLAEALGDSPAALVQAAVHITTTGQGIDDYLRLVRLRLSRLRPPESRENQPVAALGITLDGLARRDPDAYGLLTECSYLGPAGYAPVRPGEAEPPAMMRTLDRLELGRMDQETGSLLVPRWVREAVRNALPRETAAQARERVHAQLSAMTPASGPEVEATWTARASITPHLASSDIVSADGDDARAVVIDQARFLYHSGDFEGCRALAEEAVTRWRRRHGDDDAFVLDAASVLTDVLYASGRPKQVTEAMALTEDILRSLRSTHGPDDTAILLAAGRLGGGRGLRHQGGFASAYELDDAIWRRTRQRYGGDHPHALHAAGQVATGLYLLGRFHEAHAQDAALLDRLSALHDGGTVNREVVHATQCLARDLHALGSYDEALRRLDAILSPARDALGRDHALVLHAERTRAAALRKAGRLTDAARLAEQTVDAHLRRFGADHPATLAAKTTAALAGSAAGAPGLGRVLAEEALSGYRRTLGDDHPFTSACAIDLASVMRRVGDVQAALELDRNAVAALERDGGPGRDHFHALCGAAGMANDLYLLGELRAAHDLVSRTRDGFEARHGPSHPYTLACAHNLAVIGRALSGAPDPGTGTAAREALSGLLGEGHPEVRAAAQDDLLECDIDLPSL
ncbi:cytochrome c [Actinomadura sp. NBRC 104412]|uniref:FxSxx-COOH system tetratricopeptide repeat protein n=1 Tax=Actinomadura sp. NBRC 104412 TaxID=3032203 RepID=UPI0024A2879F|nr:FxSxx-COOH system tetratricopeptide repeat protein [Actinomadura sp. NBRC 104412]GLZ08563.1 cytochrome c [Actinomadura sp. NBRC 104412]